MIFPSGKILVDAVSMLEVERIREAEIYNSQRLGGRADPTQLLYGEAPHPARLRLTLRSRLVCERRLIEAARKFWQRIRNEGLISLDTWRMVKVQLPFL